MSCKSIPCHYARQQTSENEYLCAITSSAKNEIINHAFPFEYRQIQKMKTLFI